MLTITFRTINNDQYTLSCCPEDNFVKIIQLLSEKTDKKSENINVIFRGKIIKPEETVSQIGLKDGDFCVLSFKRTAPSENIDEEKENEENSEESQERDDSEEEQQNMDTEEPGDVEHFITGLLNIFMNRPIRPDNMIELSEEQKIDINELVNMGFDEQSVKEAYLACDCNMELAANYLLSRI